MEENVSKNSTLDEIVYLSSRDNQGNIWKCGQFHVSAYFTVHRPYFHMFPLDINISVRVELSTSLPPCVQLPQIRNSKLTGLLALLLVNLGFLLSFTVLLLVAVYEEKLDMLIDD